MSATAVPAVSPQTGQPATPTPPPAGGGPDGELLIKAGGQIYGSWEKVSLTTRVLGMPNDFAIQGTAKYPGEPRTLLPLNVPTTILIGGKVVLTGFIERSTKKIGPEEHTVDLIGRGRCCDLVDCSAIIEGKSSIMGASIGSLANQLVAPFPPIVVVLPDGDGDKKDYTFAVNLSESPYEILERVGRYEGLIPYENAAGNLVLARAGKVSHASGFTLGQNVQSIELFASCDERFSVYIPQIMSADAMGQIGAGGNAAGAPVKDPAITRNRPKIIISEQATNGVFLAQQRAVFEALQREGRSFRITLVCDSWLDSAGTPWTPNMLAPISVPSEGLNLPGFVITEVNFRRDGQTGTTAHITLMDPKALAIEPQALQGFAARMIPPSSSASGPLGQPTPAVAPLSAQNSGANFNPKSGEGAGP